MSELEVAAGELRVLATVRMGQLLPPKPTREALSRMGGEGKARASAGSREEPAEPPRVSKKDAFVARALAAIPPPVRDRAIAEAKARNEAPTVAAILRAGAPQEVLE